MEEKDSLMMSFPSIPPNFISLQKLQQLRLEEKEEVKKKKQEEEEEEEEEEERERCLKVNQNKVLHQVTDKTISSSNGFYYNQKKWKNELQIKGGRNTVEPAVYSEKSKNKSKEKEISKPTTSNGSYNKKKCHKIIRERRKEEVGFFKVLEPVDSKKQKKSKDDKEKQENQEKLLSEDGSISSKREKEMGLGLKSSQEIDLEKEEKKKKRRERNKKMKEEWLRKKLDRQQKTLVDENGGDVKEIKSMEVKDQISVNPTVEIVVDDESKKMKVEEEEEEINGGHQLWRKRRKKKSPIIRNVVGATTVLSNPTAEIVRNINVVRVVGDDQKGKNRRSTVGMNRGFGGGFGNGRNAKGRNRDNEEKNLMWVKKGETMNSTGGNAF